MVDLVVVVVVVVVVVTVPVVCDRGENSGRACRRLGLEVGDSKSEGVGTTENLSARDK